MRHFGYHSGKFIENMSKRMDAYFETNEEEFVKRTTSPLYKGSIVCREDFTISFLRKKHDRMKQCHHIGATILELSKLLLATHFYDHIQPAFGWRSTDVVLSDTDSLLLHLDGVDAQEAMTRLADVMDLSNLPEENPLRECSRAKVPGLLKNECPKRAIREVAAVKTKSYYCKTHDGECFDECGCKATAKGVRRNVTERLDIEHYKSCIFGIRQLHVTQTMLSSKDHVNRLVRLEKVAFSSLDDKRYQLCNVHSSPYGSRQEAYHRSREEGPCVYCEADRRKENPARILRRAGFPAGGDG